MDDERSGADVYIFDALEIKKVKEKNWEHFRQDMCFSEQDELLKLRCGTLYCRELGSDIPFGAAWDKIYKKTFIDENALSFHESIKVLDDMFFNFEVFGKAQRVIYAKKRIYCYVRNNGSITSSYTPGRAEKDMEVWKELQRSINERSLPEDDRSKLIKAFNKRVIKSFAIACKLDYLNIKNPEGLLKGMTKALKLSAKPVYKDAFTSVKVSDIPGLETKLYPFVFGVKAYIALRSVFGKRCDHTDRSCSALFISTKNLSYIRNVQDIERLKRRYITVDIIGSDSNIYLGRILLVFFKMFFTDYRRYIVVFAGFAPQLYLPVFLKRVRRSGCYIIQDFFISLYDTFCFDRKIFRPDSVIGKMLFKIDKKTLLSSDKIICDTRSDAAYFAREFGAPAKKIRVRYLKADTGIYSPDAVKTKDGVFDKLVLRIPALADITERKLVLYFGSVLPLQGVDVVIDAMQKLSEGLDYCCIFVGPVKNGVKRDIKNNRIIFVDYLSQDMLSALIYKSDICLAGHFDRHIMKASRTIPGKAFIYEAMEKPMILGDNPANREYFKESDRHIYVGMGDAKQLEMAVRKYFG